MGKPLVSICCLTYNHEPYIRECLDGFVTQQTNFPFEVLIHDDASTDRTADVIREYEAKYPDIIKPIYQTENQYSKGLNVDQVYNFPRAQGKYIALCEGDDCWTDPHKLQLQFDFLESHPGHSMCCHNVMLLDQLTGKMTRQYRWKPNQNFSLRDVIRCDGGFISTQSIFFRIEYLPTIFKYSENCSVGDYPLQIALANCGKVFYDRRCMAVYRRNCPGSWTSRVDDLTAFTSHIREMYAWFEYLQSLGTLPEDDIKFMLGKYRIMELWLSPGFSAVKKDPLCRYYLRHARLIVRLYLLAQIIGVFKKVPILRL